MSIPVIIFLVWLVIVYCGLRFMRNASILSKRAGRSNSDKGDDSEG